MTPTDPASAGNNIPSDLLPLQSDAAAQDEIAELRKNLQLTEEDLKEAQDHFHEFKMEADAEIGRLRGAQGWQPIETANPKDTIDCWRGATRFTNCRFMDGKWKFLASDRAWYDTLATHWMPLPLAPDHGKEGK